MNKPREIKLRRVRTLPKLPPRRCDAHKGDFGRVLVIGGSRGMIGAPALVANAALRSGAGLVTVACPKSIQPFVATLCPCATSIPLPENAAGQIEPGRSLRELGGLGLLKRGRSPSVIAVGPGLAQGSAAFRRGLMTLLRAFGERAGVPAVLDADALNAMNKSSPRQRRGWDNTPHFRTVITPHPGEMARLNGAATREVQCDREGFAVRTALALTARADDPDYRAVVVLKGARSVVTDGKRVYANQTGNPGMATGGSGDVLTGTIAALIAQGLDPFDAAVLGVYLHGLAGDLAAKRLGEISLRATDVIEHLPGAFRSLCAP